MSSLPPPRSPDPGQLPPYPAGYVQPAAQVQRSPHGPYAGFWRRAGARLLDALLGVAVAALCATPAIVAAANGDTEVYRCVVDEDGFEIDHDLIEEFGLEPNAICEDLTDGAYALVGGLALLGAVPLILFVIWLYRRLGRTGQTPGRAATKVALVDANTGLPIGGGRAFGRDVFGGNISLYALGLGFLWALWDKRKQTWHDKVVTSVAVRSDLATTASYVPAPPPPPPPAVPHA